MDTCDRCGTKLEVVGSFREPERTDQLGMDAGKVVLAGRCPNPECEGPRGGETVENELLAEEDGS